MSTQIQIFDTTLRDGEQSPGCSMNGEEKIRMARQLERLRVDVIEAGFPIASRGDFEGVKAVAQQITGCTIAGLARAKKEDIETAWEAVRVAKKPRIHTFIATSDIHLVHKLKKTREQVLQDTVEAVRLARSLAPEVEFSCEDASRSDIGFLAQVVEAAIANGATIINLPDTVGYAVPEEYAKMFTEILRLVPSAHTITLSSHCHNDLGLAVANSLAAVGAGVRQVECTVNGIGERAGNAALEEIAMAIATRESYLNLTTGINTEEISRSSKLLTTLTGMMVQRNKAIVGMNAFAHEAGIHQDGVLKSAITYEIMTPQSVGIKQSSIILGKHSGRHAIKQRCAELGYDLTPEELDRTYKAFCSLADQKKELYDEELVALIEDPVDEVADHFLLEGLHVSTGTRVRPTATVEIRRAGELLVDSATGDGPVDAAYKAIERITGVIGKLEEYSLKSVSLGHDTVGEAFVRITLDGIHYNGRAASTDVVTGSVLAYLDALNRALSAKAKRDAKLTGSIVAPVTGAV
jgi:2-isopropylmalate synthase